MSLCILFLSKTFLTLSLADMANRVQLSGPVEAEKYVLHMVRVPGNTSSNFYLS